MGVPDVAFSSEDGEQAGVGVIKLGKITNPVMSWSTVQSLVNMKLRAVSENQHLLQQTGRTSPMRAACRAGTC